MWVHAGGQQSNVSYQNGMNLLYFLLTHSSHLIFAQALKNTFRLSVIKSCEYMQEGNKVMFLVKMEWIYFTFSLLILHTYT